jgi:hypothetical protein
VTFNTYNKTLEDKKKDALVGKNRRAAMSPEEKEDFLAKRREEYAAMSPEKKRGLPRETERGVRRNDGYVDHYNQDTTYKQARRGRATPRSCAIKDQGCLIHAMPLIDH